MTGSYGAAQADRPGGGRPGRRADAHDGGPVREMHLAVELPGPGTAGTWPEDGRAADFAAYVRLARAAERGRFDFLLLGDGGPPREGQPGFGAGTRAGPAAGALAGPEPSSRDARNWPEPFTVLNALAAVTERIGLAAAVDPGGRDPYGLARRLAALDRLSAGRAAGPALAVPEFTAPTGPQSRPVTIGGPADAAAPEVVLLDRPCDGGAVVVPGAGERTPPGAKILARIDITLAARAEPPAESGGANGPAGLPGEPEALAARLVARFRSGAVDGFLLRPAPLPGGHGLDLFVERVVPLLQARGALRTAYRGSTLRDHLGLPTPAPPVPPQVTTGDDLPRLR
ncbi:LLM class flavin-dependent oxidoreductase [Actinacidiphila acididurans]|uniref:LLM class flavin-dependent oxidoreductase n=1 Tax=Actinacidiphila acididurans TaxID=2784346 RepID=UPI0027DC6CC6|nr:LLM class flavin-dependent oxidoreductase [Actinacidiphila acididurans]